ncbi:MAG: hypothetical protein JSW58_06440, partial [Candidatus Latescibacterota bacterium]
RNDLWNGNVILEQTVTLALLLQTVIGWSNNFIEKKKNVKVCSNKGCFVRVHSELDFRFRTFDLEEKKIYIPHPCE